MVKVPTTDGMEDEVSEIYTFKVSDPSFSAKLSNIDPFTSSNKGSHWTAKI